jgi:hypothetical protein
MIRPDMYFHDEIDDGQNPRFIRTEDLCLLSRSMVKYHLYKTGGVVDG